MVKIDDDYCILANSHGYTLVKKTKLLNSETGKRIYSPKGYFTRIDQVLQKYMEECLKQGIEINEINNISQILNGVKEIKNTTEKLYARYLDADSTLKKDTLDKDVDILSAEDI